MSELDKSFWNNLYEVKDTGWDLGEISPPLKAYIDQLEDKSIRILIPGAGNAHEAEYLFTNGFNNVSIVDISPLAVENFKSRIPYFPQENVHCANFFELEGEYDLILEQTFFCAIDPTLRLKYAQKCNGLLAERGKIAGVMFGFPLTEDGPPFGGSRNEYEKYFQPLFDMPIMDDCYNSNERRAGRELFVKLIKK